MPAKRFNRMDTCTLLSVAVTCVRCWYCSSIEAKVDMDLVKAALATKSDRADVIAATNSITDITSRSEVLNARVSEVVSELRRFQEETKSGIITATRAANEARAAVSACLSAASLQESCFASAAGVNAVQEEVSKLGVELKEAWSKLELKADIEAVNEVLETKANKVTVAQALHNKVSKPVASTTQCLNSAPDPATALARRKCVILHTALANSVVGCADICIKIS